MQCGLVLHVGGLPVVVHPVETEGYLGLAGVNAGVDVFLFAHWPGGDVHVQVILELACACDGEDEVIALIHLCLVEADLDLGGRVVVRDRHGGRG